MPPAPLARVKTRPHPTAPIDALVGAGLLAGAALLILPMLVALAGFAIIAAIFRRR